VQVREPLSPVTTTEPAHSCGP